MVALDRIPRPPAPRADARLNTRADAPARHVLVKVRRLALFRSGWQTRPLDLSSLPTATSRSNTEALLPQTYSSIGLRFQTLAPAQASG